MSLTWRDVLAEEKHKRYFQELIQRVEQQRSAGAIIYPPSQLVFNALKLTPLAKVQVVIIGQDPYHGPGQAHGLCFSVPRGIKPPPSLKNIFKALQHDDPHYRIPQHGDLSAWAEQGVLLLNTVLTVAEGQAHSHAKWGWERFTTTVIEQVNEHREGVVFMLWGAHAQKMAPLIDAQRHHILTSVHPSPLSAHRGFIDCGHFKRCNELLTQPIDWQLAE